MTTEDSDTATDGGTAAVQPSNNLRAAHDLSAFQRDLLTVLKRNGPEYGLGIKRQIEDLYNAEVNHGRLYPNLDDLIEMGLLEKYALDKRTNEYALTERGESVIESYASYMASAAYSTGQ